MNLLPKTEGNRPRLACEIAVGAVVAARSPEPGAPLSAVARVELAEGAVVPSLKPGNIADRLATITALRRAMEQVGARPNARNAFLTLVIPDGAVRVLLLDFEALPSKLTEALPIVRFRLKKLVPFDTDQAMVSFRVMSTSRSAVRVLAVAIPRDVLNDYETVAREAGYEPGAVLPSTLAALAALPESEGGTLAVNVHPSAVTTAIVRGGVLLLHRTIELIAHAGMTVEMPTGEPMAGIPDSPASLPAELFEPSAATEYAGGAPGGLPLSLVDREATAEEWAAQEPLPEFGRNPYMDAISVEMAVEAEDSITGMPVRGEYDEENESRLRADDGVLSENGLREDAGQNQKSRIGQTGQVGQIDQSPYGSPELTEDLRSEVHNQFLPLPLPAALHTNGHKEGAPLLAQTGRQDENGDGEPPVHMLAPDVQAEEIARTVSVAAAYFEDLLSAPPEVLLSAGPRGAERLSRTLTEQGVLQELGLRSRELVEAAALAAEATTAAVPRGMLAGVVGALRS